MGSSRDGQRRRQGSARDLVALVRAAALIGALLPAPAFAGAANANETHTISAGGVARSYILHNPASSKRGPLPLLIALHGGGGAAAGTAAFTGFDPIADREGFVVAYPDALHRRWNDGQAPDAVDDVAFIRALIDTLTASGDVDPKRVYVAGISNGGIMAFHLACKLADKVVAIATVAASMAQRDAGACSNLRGVAVVMFNGTADPLVPYGGGRVRGFPRFAGDVMPVESTLTYFARRDGCTGLSTTTRVTHRDASDNSQVEHVAFSGCPASAAVELYRIAGGGHTWPGGRQYLPVSVIGPTNRDIDASETIWTFVSRFSR